MNKSKKFNTEINYHFKNDILSTGYIFKKLIILF